LVPFYHKHYDVTQMATHETSSDAKINNFSTLQWNFCGYENWTSRPYASKLNPQPWIMWFWYFDDILDTKTLAYSPYFYNFCHFWLEKEVNSGIMKTEK
jgi:hypothetical protein